MSRNCKANVLTVLNMKQEKKMVNFRISEELAEDLKNVAEQLEIPQSQIARAALKQKVSELRGAVKDVAEKQLALNQ